MNFVEKLKSFWNNDIKSFILRVGAIWIIILLCAWYLGFQKDIIDLSVITTLYVCLGILLAGLSTWGFTKLNFVKQGDTISLVNIFRAIMTVIAALIIAYYFRK